MAFPDDTSDKAGTADAAPPGAPGRNWSADRWYLACTSAELVRGRQFRRMILGEPVLLARTAGGEVFALRDICPHRLVPLSAGRQLETNGEPTVECPYHGWRFGTDGGCRLMPSLTEADQIDPARIRVRRYPLVETAGLVLIYVSANARDIGPPAITPPDFGELSGPPDLHVDHLLAAPMENAVAALQAPAITASARLWKTRPFRTLFGAAPVISVTAPLHGVRRELLQGARAHLVSLTCLTPETDRETRATQVSWWRGAPLLRLMLPQLKSAARADLRALQ